MIGLIFLKQAVQRHIRCEELLNGILALTAAERDAFVKEFEVWLGSTSFDRYAGLVLCYARAMRSWPMPWEVVDG